MHEASPGNGRGLIACGFGAVAPSGRGNPDLCLATAWKNRALATSSQGQQGKDTQGHQSSESGPRHRDSNSRFIIALLIQVAAECDPTGNTNDYQRQVAHVVVGSQRERATWARCCRSISSIAPTMSEHSVERRRGPALDQIAGCIAVRPPSTFTVVPVM